MGTLEISDTLYQKTRAFCDATDQRFKTYVETAIEEFLHVGVLAEKLYQECETKNRNIKLDKITSCNYNVDYHQKRLAEIESEPGSDPNGNRRRYHQSRLDRAYFGQPNKKTGLKTHVKV